MIVLAYCYGICSMFLLGVLGPCKRRRGKEWVLSTRECRLSMFWSSRFTKDRREAYSCAKAIRLFEGLLWWFK